MNEVSKFLIGSLKKVLKKKKIHFTHEPSIRAFDKKIISDIIDRNEISIGKNVNKFEDLLKKYTSSQFVLSLNSGTSAIHLSLLALGMQKNFEVLLPSFNFIASLNSILYCQGVPNFIDTQINSLLLDAKLLEDYLNEIAIIKKNKTFNRKTGRRIFALISLHTFGHIADLPRIQKICKKFNLFHIEDATEALGSFYNKEHVGTFSDVGVLSFNGNKIITTGMGGAILTGNKKIYEKAKFLSLVNKKKHLYNLEYEPFGFNYRLSNINASLGVSQMLSINSIVLNKKKITRIYQNLFKDNPYFSLLKSDSKIFSPNYWFQAIILKDEFIKYKDDIITDLLGQKIYLRPAWDLLDKNLVKSKIIHTSMPIENSKKMQKKVICLPSSESSFDL